MGRVGNSVTHEFLKQLTHKLAPFGSIGVPQSGSSQNKRDVISIASLNCSPVGSESVKVLTCAEHVCCLARRSNVCYSVTHLRRCLWLKSGCKKDYESAWTRTTATGLSRGTHK